MKNLAKKILAKSGLVNQGARTSKKNNPIPDDHLKSLTRKIAPFTQKLEAIRVANPINKENGFWFPHSVLGNIKTLNQTLTGNNRDLLQLADKLPIADIGGADGELSFFLEENGFSNIHLIDYSELSCNKQEGARILKRDLGSNVQIHDINVDTHFELPHEKYGLVFFLGLLYHLKNPFYALETLARKTRYCLISTRITKYLPTGTVNISGEPVSYLLGEDELNNDPSNYWVFSEKGLERILHRTGWDILDFNTFDNVVDSVPASLEKGERAFLLAKSRF